MPSTPPRPVTLHRALHLAIPCYPTTRVHSGHGRARSSRRGPPATSLGRGEYPQHTPLFPSPVPLNISFSTPPHPDDARLGRVGGGPAAALRAPRHELVPGGAGGLGARAVLGRAGRCWLDARPRHAGHEECGRAAARGAGPPRAGRVGAGAHGAPHRGARRGARRPGRLAPHHRHARAPRLVRRAQRRLRRRRGPRVRGPRVRSAALGGEREGPVADTITATGCVVVMLHRRRHHYRPAGC